MYRFSFGKKLLSFFFSLALILTSFSTFPFETSAAPIEYTLISYNSTTGRGEPQNLPPVNGHAVQRTQITGHPFVEAIFGTEGWPGGFNNADYRAAFDGVNTGATGTFFDGYIGGFCGLEFKEPQIVSQIVYRTRQRANRLDGAVFQGSHDGIEYTTLYTIECPAINVTYTKNVENSSLNATTAYKYYRIYSANAGDMLNVCELYLYTYAESVDPFDVLSIPDTVNNGYALPTNVIGNPVVWSADKVEMLNGNIIVAKPLTTSLTLTATIGEESKDFTVSVTGILNALDIPITMTNGYVLPISDGITWSSSEPSLLIDGNIIKAKAYDTAIELTATLDGASLVFPVTITGILDGIVLSDPLVSGTTLPTQSFGEDITWECDPPSLLVDGVIRATVKTTATLTAIYGDYTKVFPNVSIVLVQPVVFTGNEWNLTDTSTSFIYHIAGENPRSNYYLYDTEQKALKNFTLYPFENEAGTVTNSEYILPLNGTWKFYFAINPNQRPWPAAGIGQEPRNFISPGFDASSWDDITVPNSWQVNFKEDGTAKYDQPQYVNSANAWSRYASGNSTTAPAAPTNFNGVGTYRRHFVIPEDWDGKQIFLNFDGISACYIWINGQPVGWTTDIWTHHEFDVTPYVNIGENVIVLQLIRWTSGSWLENQDMLRLSGIARNVYLMARNPEDIWDFEFTTKPVSPENLNSGQDTEWTLNLKVAVRDFLNRTRTNGESKKVHFKLYDADGNLVAQDSKTAAYKYVNFKTSTGVSGQANITSETLPFGGGVRYTATPDITDSTNISLAIPEFTTTIENPRLWSAEDPYLYKLVMYVDNGEETEYTCVRLGFRYMTYVNATNSQTVTDGEFIESAGSYWLINGKRVTFYGTNIHETNPDTGYPMTLDLIRKDLVLMKRHNVNAIRMAHYPHDTRYYDIADELGIYVMDEANHESHGNTSLSNASYFLTTLRDRMLNMYERDKNMTCVVAWSAGNEASMNATSAAYSIWVLKARENELNGPTGIDGGRPTHAQYGQAYADMWAGMYPSYGSINQPNENKVKINCEYSHAMGNAMGNMDTYVRIYDGNSYCAGGFIWDWVDQSIKTPVPPSDTITGIRGDRSGEGTFFGYDGDWGNYSGDLDFCANGVLCADRTPKPHASEVKRQYQRLKVYASDEPTATSVGFTVKNYYMYTNANAFDMTWQLLESGTVIRQGSGVLDIDPAPYAIANDKFTARTFAVDFDEVTKKPGAEYFFNIQFRLRESTAWAEAGYPISENQLPLTTGAFTPTEKPVVPVVLDKIQVNETDGTIEVKGPDNLFEYKFDKTAGTFTQMKFKGRTFATLGYEPNFYMPLTDNQYGEGTSGTRMKDWKYTGANRTQVSTSTSVANIYENYVEIVNQSANTSPSAQNVQMTTTYKIYPTGEVNIGVRYVFGSSAAYTINVVGGYLELVPGLENITYFARGPFENYVDRKAGNDVGLYTTTVSDNYFEYICSQDTGEHLDTRWAAITDNSGFGVIMKAGEFPANNLFTGTGSSLNPDEKPYNMANLVEFNALHYSPTQFGDARQKHPYQVYDEFGRNDANLPTYFYINIASRGRGADTSWGNQARPKAPYIINVANKTVNYNFSIIPVDDFDADWAMMFSKTKHSAYQNVKDLMTIAAGAGVPADDPAYMAADALESTAGELDAINIYNALYKRILQINQVAAPTASVEPGTYNSVQIVELSTSTEGANIYYTTNGAVPDVSDTVNTKLYTGPITINTSTTIKAIAVKEGMIDSAVAEFTYVINSPSVTLTADAVVAPDIDFTVNVKLDGLIQDIYAEDITISFDKDLFTFVGIEPATGVIIANEPVAVDGKIRIIAANEGGITGAKQILAITFRSGNNATSEPSAITVTSAKLGSPMPLPVGTVVEAECGSTMVSIEPVFIPVTGITIEQGDTMSMQVGETATLTAVIEPADATDKTITWSSDNTDAVTVDADGNVTANAVGTAIITATAGGVSDTITITVYPISIPATDITLSANELKISVGTEATLTATVTPANSTSELVWSSNDPAVATVDLNGKVTAIAAGTAIITVASKDDPTVNDSCTVTVYIANDLNNDGSVNIGDLAIAAYYYGAKSGDENWDEAKIADVNADGIVDILDLASIAVSII